MPYLTAVLSAERAGLAGALSLGTAPLAAPFGDLTAFSRLSLGGIANSTVAGISTAVPAGSTEIGAANADGAVLASCGVALASCGVALCGAAGRGGASGGALLAALWLSSCTAL